MSTVFYRGMVVDIINSVSGLTIRNKSIEDYQKLINTPNLKSFPRNAIVVKQISEGASKISNNEIICYPFFSSHFSMPLKPGECVWFVFENPDNQGPIAFWLSRVTEPGHVEDLNFTHFPRSYRQAPTEAEPGTAARSEGVPAKSDTTQTYSWISATNDPNEQTETIAFAEKVHRFEPVPRYNKRPGDLIIQGSNNSLIMLGEERGHYNESAFDIKESANQTKIPPGLAAIDIVVGRGKMAATSGAVITNELNLKETDKRQDPQTEGDPHFPTDASRLYLTANSADIFSLYHPDTLLQIQLPSTIGMEEYFKARAGSFFVGKADNLRLVARHSGDIRIIKEPKPGDIDGAAIILHASGSLQACGKRIQLSSYNTDGAGIEPYVRYSGLVTLIKKMIDDYTSIASDINDFCISFNSAIPQIATLTTATGPVTNGAPLVALLTSAAAQLQAKATIMMAQKDFLGFEIDTDFDNIKSDIVFAE
jgi:hypothetical protein